MTTTSENQLKAPYLSFITFKNFIVGLGEAAMPSRIDKSVMPSQSGGTQSYILGAMRFFGLINETAEPTESLRQLVAQSKDEDLFRRRWAEILVPAYAPVIQGLDLERSTAAQLQERLKDLFSYNGDTLRKSHAFFNAAYEAAGIELGSHLKVVGRATSTRKKSKTPPPPQPQANQADPFISKSTNPGDEVATLRLDPYGKRVIRLFGPAVVTPSELERIQQWLGFHFIVMEDIEPQVPPSADTTS